MRELVQSQQYNVEDPSLFAVIPPTVGMIMEFYATLVELEATALAEWQPESCARVERTTHSLVKVPRLRSFLARLIFFALRGLRILSCVHHAHSAPQPGFPRLRPVPLLPHRV